MGEDRKIREKATSNNIEEILQQREHLEQMLKDKFKKEVTILFTDICGYTEYVDARGDINGRALLLKHNRMVLPVIEKHGGRVVEIVGDAVMAAFADPLSAVKVSMTIQRTLNEYNRKTESADRIHVKIGIHLGEALVDEGAVYQGFAGDVANVASRIQTQAGPDQIFISKEIYKQVCGSEDILCRLQGTIQVKGKAQPLEIYRVVWGYEDTVLSTDRKIRHYEAIDEELALKRIKVFELDVNREGDHLKIGAHEAIIGEESSIRHYEQIKVSISWIETQCRELVETLNKTSRKGSITREVLVKLREIGQVLYDELFSLSIKEKLAKTEAEYLILRIDDQLVQIPWELLNDGQKFLCQRFSMGRLVKTRQPILGIRNRILARPLKMLILADPEGDLNGAYAEGVQIRDYMDHDKELVNVSLRSDNITREYVKGKIKNFDFAHFAGHAEYDAHNPARSGWRLTRDSLMAQDITKMAGTGNMPALVFANACQSARTEEWSLEAHFHEEIFGLANAFLLAGVRHYVGTFWEILDKPSTRFALEFYKNLLSGMSAGKAMRLARLVLIEEYGEETIVWASYVLYGDPTFSYMAQLEKTKVQMQPHYARAQVEGTDVRAREEVIDLADHGVARKRRGWWVVAAGIILVAALVFWGYQLHSKREIAQYNKAVVAYYQEGNFEGALDVCKILDEKRSGTFVSHLVRGNIYLKRGKLDLAEASYRKALQGAEGTKVQRAEAFVGLGRIASLRKQPSESLKYYQQATETAPDSRQGYLSQALLLESRGDYDEALDLLVKAQKLEPKDRSVAGLVKDTRERVALAHDRKNQERIDQLVKELMESTKSPPWALPSDGWTSFPLTMWVMDFEAQGYSAQEGAERLLVSGIVDHVLEHSRMQLVERALLDRLLEELKLGTSTLVDRQTALSVGKIVAARLILFGQVVYSDLQTQISMRVIETETGRITIAVNESFGSAVPVSDVADKLSKELMKRLEQLYPLRGTIAKVKDKEEIELNIGQRVGVRMGQRFKVLDKDVILEAIEIQRDTSLTKISEGKARLQAGLRVEAK